MDLDIVEAADAGQAWGSGMTPTDWREQAPCVGAGALFFAGNETGEARRVCRACPFAEVCLLDAMAAETETPYRYGVWGGKSSTQREQLHRALGWPAKAEYEQRRDAALAVVDGEAVDQPPLGHRACVQCGSPFPTLLSQPNRLYCRRACADEAERQRRTRLSLVGAS